MFWDGDGVGEGRGEEEVGVGGGRREWEPGGGQEEVSWRRRTEKEGVGEDGKKSGHEGGAGSLCVRLMHAGARLLHPWDVYGTQTDRETADSQKDLPRRRRGAARSIAGTLRRGR